ncbi:NAD(P)-dependent oxidoreductase [Aminobacter sp. SS-2016]|uniref:NAD-dependent epimerase/dehydratase family protein n=1 Tax=Aminobacter sp. Y103A TaxID=1870862 RepID=UPI0025742B3F|nr:NAD(P)-dependent oxidoreductase [Aminobacter sp. SS-2016]
MRIVLTGSSGRIGRAIFGALSCQHEIVGLDRSPFSTTHVVGDIANEMLLRTVLRRADAVIHTAALHAPHVGTVPNEEFQRINVKGTELIAREAIAAGVKRFVFTSTTALYGHAVSVGSCTWIDEDTAPLPTSIYHRTKLEAEYVLEGLAGPEFAVRVLRMSRSFPEPGDIMAAYRLHRGIDARDVADAHVAALSNSGAPFQRYIVSATSPFTMEDCECLSIDAASVVRRRAPDIAAKFDQRGWRLPLTIDRVYDASRAKSGLGWQSMFNFDEVMAQMARRSLEVLPAGSRIMTKSE